MFGRKVKAMEILNNHLANVVFDTGETRKIDFSDVVIDFGGIAKPLADVEYFKKVTIKNGVPTWGNSYDICPDYLYMFDENGFKKEFIKFAPQKIIDKLNIKGGER